MKRELVGRKILRFKAVDSTNEHAKELISKDLEEGTAVVAERQTQGKGRFGRSWASPKGGLYLSVILKPSQREVQRLSLFAGVPVVEALSHYGLRADLKWPNDIMVRGKKLGGILCEGVHRWEEYYVIVGIGINSNTTMDRLPKNLRDGATSMRVEMGKSVDNEELLELLLDGLDEMYLRYRSAEYDTLMHRYKKLCTTLGRRILVEAPSGKFKGLAMDVAPTGFLILKDEKGRIVEIADGTVRHLE